MDRELFRLMGSRHEIRRQQGRSMLAKLFDLVDPWNEPHMDASGEEGRQETEADVWQSNGPLKRVKLEDGSFEMRTTTTARTPRGDERHAQNGKVIRSEIIPRDE